MPERPSRDSASAPEGDHYAAMQQAFRWSVPARFNMAQACSRRWAVRHDASERIAVVDYLAPAESQFHSYAELQAAADRLAHGLVALGVARGERVAIVMPQRFETAVAYMAVLQLGAVAMPLSQLFGPEALEYRLQDAAAVAAICDEASVDALLSVRATCPKLATVIGLGAAAGRADQAWDALLAGANPSPFAAADTLADDAAVLIYTSGTTGPPKGALIPHRALIGNLTGFLCSQNGFGFALDGPEALARLCDPATDLTTCPEATVSLPRKGEGQGGGARDLAAVAHAPAEWSPSPGGGRAGEGESLMRAWPSEGGPNTPVFWSPADWAWTGGLMDALLPTLYVGRPIVAFAGRFSAEAAFELLQACRVTHTFLFPTALKAMMKAVPRPSAHYALHLQAIMSAGEAVGDAVFGYCQEELGVTVNEMFGQTEVNYIVGNCALNGHRQQGTGWPARAGSMGKGYPGHRVAVIDEQGHESATGEPGEVAIHRRDVHGVPDPIFFLGYWNRPEATTGKFTGDWCRTGDLAVRDADGYLWYQGRADDMFKAAGYRIGPGEIENCLVKHAAVANCAVVPKPDPERGALVKAYVVLTPEFIAARSRSERAGELFDAQLVAELQAHVRGQLAPYEYPKEIEFIDALPMTTTGKVQRRVLRLQEEERARAAGG